MATEKKFLGPAGTQQLITEMRNEFAAADAANLAAAKKYADDLGGNYDPAGTAQTKVNELANGQVKTNTAHIGAVADLETSAKTDLVTAINEVRNAVSAGGTAAAITLTTAATPASGMSKTYTLKQGDNTVGTIDIPKDMVVQSGSVVTNPSGQAAGTYIKLVLANATNDEIYVNVGTLIDIYTAQASATQVQLAIDSATRVVSATIVDGAVTAAKLAANAVTTAKIADGNVTTDKLADRAVTGGKIDSYTITKYHLANSSVESLAIANEAIESRHIKDGIITSDKLATEFLNNLVTESELGQYTSVKPDCTTLEDILLIMDTDIEGLQRSVKTLKDTTYTEITAAEVTAMFA